MPKTEWYGELPQQWKEVPLFSAFREVSTPNDGLSEPNILTLSYGEIRRRNNLYGNGLIPKTFETYQIVEYGDIVLRLTDMQNDQRSLRTGMAVERGSITSAYLNLRPTEGPHRYFYYLFQALDLSKVLYGIGGGVRQSLKFGDLKHIMLPMPLIETQDRIVEFLDAELGRIDTLQTGLQRLADLVEERRLARLTSSFSSFDTAEKLKLKWILKKRSEEATPGSGTVTAFRDGQVTLRELRREDGYTFSETEDGYQAVHQGDLVFHGLDGFAGAVGIAEEDGNCSPVYHVCSLRNPDYDLTFIAKYLRYLGLSGYLATEAPNVRQRSVDFRNWDRFANLLLPFPQLEEQRRILASLSADLEKDESFVQQVTQMQDLLKERRTALITAAVTGELEV